MSDPIGVAAQLEMLMMMISKLHARVVQLEQNYTQQHAELQALRERFEGNL